MPAIMPPGAQQTREDAKWRTPALLHAFSPSPEPARLAATADTVLASVGRSPAKPRKEGQNESNRSARLSAKGRRANSPIKVHGPGGLLQRNIPEPCRLREQDRPACVSLRASGVAAFDAPQVLL